MEVDGEPASCDEGAAARGDRRKRGARIHARPFLDPRDLAVAEHVSDVRDRLGAERDEEPDRLGRLEPGRDAVESGRPRDGEERCERDQRARDDEHERFRARPLHVALPGERLDSHPQPRLADPCWDNARDNAAVTVVIGIFGPTASGKSAVAEALAARIPAELVSADAMQVYRDLPLLTNQSTHPSRLVGIWGLEHEASVGEYAPLAHAAIDEILASCSRPQMPTRRLG